MSPKVKSIVIAFTAQACVSIPGLTFFFYLPRPFIFDPSSRAAYSYTRHEGLQWPPMQWQHRLMLPLPLDDLASSGIPLSEPCSLHKRRTSGPSRAMGRMLPC